MPRTKRPTAYDSICLMFLHVRRVGVTTVRQAIESGDVRDDGTARSALEALARHGLIVRTRRRENEAVTYYYPGFTVTPIDKKS